MTQAVSGRGNLDFGYLGIIPEDVLTKNERANLVYAVKIAVHNDGLLKIGMYGGVEFSD